MIQNVKHIIFDLGGVLLNIDYRLTEAAFVKLGISNFAELYSQASQTTLFDDFETGRCDRHVFMSGLQKLAGSSFTEGQVCEAWNAMLLDLPLRRLQILQQLRLYHDLILLSNTNEIHEEAFTELIRREHGAMLSSFFDRVYYSHRVGLRKPSPEIFTRILNENGFSAAHTLFIDDSIQHIQAANALGIQTIHLLPGMTIEKDVFLPKTSKSN